LNSRGGGDDIIMLRVVITF